MELRHLETLLAVQDAGSFTGAADHLHTVQSNVSDQIRQLEDELGGTPFRRGGRGAAPLAALAAHPMILPPLGNPLRSEVEGAAHDQGLTLSVPVEVEGVRLIGDLVAAGAGVSIIPETAVPPREPGVRSFAITDMPPRRLA